MIPILTIAGEHSGDNLGGSLLLELSKYKDFLFFGIGGEKMKAVGLQSIVEIEELTVIGLVAAAFKYRKLKKLAHQIVKLTKEKNCKHAILIDYPGFNLRLAEMLKKEISDIKIIFYVSPQIWAWKYERIYKIKQMIDLMLLLFPFEKEIYDKHNIPNEFVGHPIISEMPLRYASGKEITVSQNTKVITLMPGSRSAEIRRLLPPMLKASIKLVQHYKQKNICLEFLLPSISKKEENYILTTIEKHKQLEPSLKIQYQPNNSARCIEKAHAVIVASGTATLEVAYYEKPMVILYKTSWFTAFIARKFLLKIPYVGLVNVLSQKFICKELLQEDCTPENIMQETIQLLENETYKQEMIQNLHKLKISLGDGEPSKKGSSAILKRIFSE